MNNSESYNKIQSDLGILTSSGLINALNKYGGTEKTIISSLFVKKIEKSKNFRPLIFYIGFCLAKGRRLIPIESLSLEEKFLIGEVTAAIEAENISTYYINHYLDQKGDIKDKRDEKNRVLAGLLSRNVAQSIIENLNIDIHIKYEIIRLLKEIDISVCKAQVHEVNKGIFDNFEQFKDEKEFFTLYLERCRNISGQFYGRCAEMGYIIASGNIIETEEKRKIENFYTEMITLLQFANDIGDYAPPDFHSGTDEKNLYKDFGSDLRNRRLTYPNYLLLKRITKQSEKELINKVTKGFNPETINEIMLLMYKLNIFKDCFKLLIQLFNKEKKKLWLPRSDLRALISCSIIIVKSNKLLSSVKKYTTLYFNLQ